MNGCLKCVRDRVCDPKGDSAILSRTFTQSSYHRRDNNTMVCLSSLLSCLAGFSDPNRLFSSSWGLPSRLTLYRAMSCLGEPCPSAELLDPARSEVGVLQATQSRNTTTGTENSVRSCYAPKPDCFEVMCTTSGRRSSLVPRMHSTQPSRNCFPIAELRIQFGHASGRV